MGDSNEISSGSRRWSPAPRAVVVVLYVLGLAVAALSVYGLAGSRGPATSSLIILTAAYLPYATVGSILVTRRPANAIGWVLFALGWTFAISFLPIPATADDLQMRTASPLAEALAWLHGVGAPLTLALFALLALIFPSGRLAAGRWRRAAAVLLVLTWGLVALSALWPVLTVLPAGPAGTIEIPNPIALLPPSILGTRLMSNPAVAALPVILIASITAIITRYARAGGLERLQLHWLVAALASIVLAVLAGLVIIAVLGPGAAIAWVPAAVAFMLPPIAIGIAVMRYRLYEIDLIINRALVYGALGLIVAAAYVVLATVLGRLAGGEGSPATATVATVIAALVALAGRQAVQHAIDRLLYGRRGDPLAVIGSVARRLESAGTPEGMLTDVVGDLREALKLDNVAVYAADGKLLAGTGGTVSGTRLSLAHQGELVGELSVWTARGDELKPGDLRLLQDLGPQLAVAIEAVRLKRDLQRARERLVAALEEERRRLRHDLHDGLGPTLTAITLRADAATNLLLKDPARARELLDELRVAAGDAIAEVRQLTHGLRPLALDELGLVSAIREQAIGVDRAGMAGPEVVVDNGLELPRLPAAVEVAAYRIATEAITNAVRHAGARHCHVRITADTALEVEVTDDGHGWAGRLIPGVGIRSMRERAADLGGTLTIEPVPGGGTSVLARLPLTTGTGP